MQDTNMYDPNENKENKAVDPMNDLNTPLGGGGGPEAGGPTPESAGGSQSGVETQEEFGYEKLKQMEQSMESALEMAEKKEANRVDDPKKRKPQQPIQQKPKKKVPPKPPSNAPKYYGYNISPQMANNPKQIKQNAGKGDPKNSQTWIYVLLERLLKLRSRKK